MIEQLSKEIQALRADRQPFDDIAQELAEMCMPQLQPQRHSHPLPPGKSEIEETLSITARQANVTLASGQMSHIVPMGQRWFSLYPPTHLEKDGAAQKYFATISAIINQNLLNSNFYTVIYEQFLERGCFGHGAMNIRTGPNGRGIHFESFHPGSFSIAEDSFGKVCYLARDYKLTGPQAKQQFANQPKANLPAQIQKAIDSGDIATKYDFTHYIRPNPDHDPENIFSFAYQSHHLCKIEADTLVLTSGFHDFPTPVSRWMKWGTSPYGISPAFFALPSARQANYLETLADLTGELAVNPRMLIPSSLKGEIDLRPNGATYFDPNMGSAEMPREWLTQSNYPVLTDRLDRKEKQIEAAFYVQLFEMLAQQEKQMTALEVQHRIAEKSSLFHPIFVRVTQELIKPLILRVFAILANQPGALPPPPPSVLLQDGNGPYIPDPEIGFNTQLALAMSQNQYSGLPHVLEMVGMAAQFDPTAADGFNGSELFANLARAHNLPESLIASQEQIAAAQEARAQAQQMAQVEQAATAAQKLGGPTEIQKLAQGMTTPQ